MPDRRNIESALDWSVDLGKPEVLPERARGGRAESRVDWMALPSQGQETIHAFHYASRNRPKGSHARFRANSQASRPVPGE